MRRHSGPQNPVFDRRVTLNSLVENQSCRLGLPVFLIFPLQSR